MRVTDPLFDLPPEPPFPAGTGPFQSKGNVILGNLEFLDKQVPGGSAALIAELPPHLRGFFERRLIASDWYDAIPNVYLQTLAARRRGLSMTEHAMQVGAFHAKSRLTGIYSAVLRVVSSENVAVWAPRMNSIYYNYGKFTSRVKSPKCVAMVRSGLPQLLVRWTTVVMQGAGEETLRISGVKRVSVIVGSITESGSFAGQRLFDVEAEMTWD